MNPTYTAVATASGRESRAITADGQLDVQLAFPKEMGGTGDGINPEQLFAVGWAACFSTSLASMAAKACCSATTCCCVMSRSSDARLSVASRC